MHVYNTRPSDPLCLCDGPQGVDMSGVTSRSALDFVASRKISCLHEELTVRHNND